MKRRILKPFNLEEWKNGAKVETRDGRQVRILCADVKNDCRIVGVIIQNSTYEVIRTWYEDGRFFSTKDDDDDLVIVEEIEVSERRADNEDAKGDGWTISMKERLVYILLQVYT